MANLINFVTLLNSGKRTENAKNRIAGKENIFRYHSGTGLPISEPVQKMYKYMQRAYTGIDRN